MDTQGYVKAQQLKPGITEIEFFHPSHNSLPSSILSELAEEITRQGTNDETTVIILKSGGDRTFCAGASFNELISINDIDAGKSFFMGFANVINACRTCPKIILGRVQGKAVGGGVGVASSVDYCFATKFASVKLSELNVGIGPFVVGPAVERAIGNSAFTQMAINSDHWYSADWAREKGMYAEVYDSSEEMDVAIMAFAERLVGTNPEAQSLIKKASWEGTEHWDELLSQRADISGRLVLSEFTKEALKKFA